MALCAPGSPERGCSPMGNEMVIAIFLLPVDVHYETQFVLIVSQS